MKLVSRRIFVRGLRVDAAIGVYAHEHGRTQPLIIDAVFDLTLHDITALKDTLNYEKVGDIARAFLAKGHVTLVEALAEDMAKSLLDLPHVTRAEISISKPEALKDAAGAGCTVVFERGV
jgi:dihydroneopterin aldolase